MVACGRRRRSAALGEVGEVVVVALVRGRREVLGGRRRGRGLGGRVGRGLVGGPREALRERRDVDVEGLKGGAGEGVGEEVGVGVVGGALRLEGDEEVLGGLGLGRPREALVAWAGKG